MTAPAPISWVLGAGGLLGSSVAAALSERGPLWAPARPIPWDGPARSALAEAAQAFRDQAGGDPWRVAWCAGAGVTSSTARDLQREAAAFGALLDALSAGGSDWLARGSLFLASSAGGVYAGSTGAPFTEATPPAPLA
ncbi:MAG: hypothetical protein LBQ06_02845, partial [Frankiaceae bacterium]|nr:hypothetical protein [Frankiaceae bacterium]